MPSISILDKATQISLDALWKIQIQECIETSELSKANINTKKEMDDDSLLYHMEEGTLSPKPQELPMPPPNWLV